MLLQILIENLKMIKYYTITNLNRKRKNDKCYSIKNPN